MSTIINQEEETELTQEQKELLETLPKFENQLEPPPTTPVDVKDPWKEKFDKFQKWMVSHNNAYPSISSANDKEEIELARWFEDQMDLYKKTFPQGSYLCAEAESIGTWLLCCRT